MMASLEPTFLWRRIFRREPRFIGISRVPYVGANGKTPGDAGNLRHNICQNRMPQGNRGNASTPTEPTQALHCLLQTVGPKRETIKGEGIDCQARVAVG